MNEYHLSPAPALDDQCWRIWKGARCVTPDRLLTYEDAVVLCERLNAEVEVPA